MTFYTAALIVATGLYAIAGVVTVLTARRRLASTSNRSAPLPVASVLVAARNEEEDLSACLRALQQQDYPADRIEFIIADDGSTDATPDIIRSFPDARFQYVAVPAAPGSSLQGKARALHHAYRRSSGDVLLVTDADCTPPPGWARSMTAHVQEPGRGVVCGVTLVDNHTLLARIQAIDWLLLLTVAAAAAGLGLPITAMGNNMAIRRDAYKEVGGYPALDFSVTEDYALFRAIHERTSWTVHLFLDSTLCNYTRPLPSLRSVFSQRRRWARGGLQARLWVYLLYAAVFFAHILLVGGLYFAPDVAAPLLAAKALVDYTVLRAGSRRLGRRPSLPAFLAFEVYFFAYILIMPLALLFAPRIRWKGRYF